MKIHPKNTQKTPLEKSNINLFKMPKLSRQPDTQISVLFAARTADSSPANSRCQSNAHLQNSKQSMRANQVSQYYSQSVALLYPVFAVKMLPFRSYSSAR